MSAAMVAELRQLFSTLREDTEIQAVVLRGADGHFCAGDVRDMRDALLEAFGEVELRDLGGVSLSRPDRAAQPSLVRCSLRFKRSTDGSSRLKAR